MNKRGKIILLITVIAIGAVLFMVLEKTNDKEVPLASQDLGQEAPAQEKGQEEGQEDEPIMAPDFTFENLEGEKVSLSDQKGKLVFINFWATWCKFCDKEMPDLQRLQDENDDLVILAVNVREDKETVRKYIEKGGYNFQVLLDETGEIALEYPISGLPITYVVDKEGRLIYQVPGMMEFELMEEILEDVRSMEE